MRATQTAGAMAWQMASNTLRWHTTGGAGKGILPTFSALRRRRRRRLPLRATLCGLRLMMAFRSAAQRRMRRALLSEGGCATMLSCALRGLAAAPRGCPLITLTGFPSVMPLGVVGAGCMVDVGCTSKQTATTTAESAVATDGAPHQASMHAIQGRSQRMATLVAARAATHAAPPHCLRQLPSTRIAPTLARTSAMAAATTVAQSLTILPACMAAIAWTVGSGSRCRPRRFHPLPRLHPFPRRHLTQAL